MSLEGNGVRVPWPSGEFPHMRERRGRGRATWSSHRHGAILVRVTRPGRYEPTIPKLPGFEGPGTATLDLNEGETTDYTVTLQPER